MLKVSLTLDFFSCIILHVDDKIGMQLKSVKIFAQSLGKTLAFRITKWHAMTLENLFETDPMQDKTPLLRALGERIRSLRARKGITRKKLASLAGI
ncbi:MAG: hypothetical protein ACTH1W_09320, partial [Advenella sp.]